MLAGLFWLDASKPSCATCRVYLLLICTADVDTQPGVYS